MAKTTMDMYQLNKDFGKRVSEYVECVILRTATIESFNILIKSAKQSLDNLDNLKGSVFEDTIPAKREEFLKNIEDYKNAKAQKLQELDSFEYDDNDKAFRKAVKNISVHDRKALREELNKWFGKYTTDKKVSIKGTDFEEYILNCMGGRKSVANLVKNGEIVAKSNYLDLLYLAAFDYCVAKGTINKATIPDILKDKYETKKKTAKAAIANK